MGSIIMARYKLSNAEKKNVIETETWSDGDGNTFHIENGWRWGEWFFEFDSEPDIDLVNENGIDPWSIGDVEDQNLDDGCWCEFIFPDDFPEELKENIEEAWDNDGMFGLEELGFSHDDTETEILGPLTLEKIED